MPILNVISHIKNKFRFWLIIRGQKNRISINKRLISLIKKRPHYHHQECIYWPFYKSVSDNNNKITDVYYKNKKILTSKNFDELKYKIYEEMLIFGSGPSLKDMDLTSQNGGNFILVNGGIYLADKFPEKPFMCIILDHYFILRAFDLIKKIPEGTNLMLTLHCIATIHRKDKNFLSKYNVFFVPVLSSLYNTPCIEIEDYDTSEVIVDDEKTAGFSFNPFYGFHDGGSVITLAFQLVFMLSVKKTYVLGMDLGDYDKPYFYEKGQKGLFNHVPVIGDYEKKILPFMKLASRVFSEHNLEIYNCSPTSKLPYDIIPFSDKFIKKITVQKR